MIFIVRSLLLKGAMRLSAGQYVTLPRPFGIHRHIPSLPKQLRHSVGRLSRASLNSFFAWGVLRSAPYALANFSSFADQSGLSYRQAGFSAAALHRGRVFQLDE